MKIILRTTLFDTSSHMDEGTFHGEGFACWLQSKLHDWQSNVVGEDWGWAVCARKGKYRCNFGIYDHDANDVTDQGPKWMIRLFNERDWKSWFKSWIKHTPPTAHSEIVDEVIDILKATGQIRKLEVMPLD